MCAYCACECNEGCLYISKVSNYKLIILFHFKYNKIPDKSSDVPVHFFQTPLIKVMHS